MRATHIRARLHHSCFATMPTALSEFLRSDHSIRSRFLSLPECYRRFYSFLSLSWGIVADIDIESETYRCCGPSRFDISTMQRILCLRRLVATVNSQRSDLLLAISDDQLTTQPTQVHRNTQLPTGRCQWKWGCSNKSNRPCRKIFSSTVETLSTGLGG